MIRRNARLRKEYLYRKSLEGKEKASYERKRKIRQVRASGLVEEVNQRRRPFCSSWTWCTPARV
jgi:hypothetical protein